MRQQENSLVILNNKNSSPQKPHYFTDKKKKSVIAFTKVHVFHCDSVHEKIHNNNNRQKNTHNKKASLT